EVVVAGVRDDKPHVTRVAVPPAAASVDDDALATRWTHANLAGAVAQMYGGAGRQLAGPLECALVGAGVCAGGFGPRWRGAGWRCGASPRPPVGHQACFKLRSRATKSYRVGDVYRRLTSTLPLTVSKRILGPPGRPTCDRRCLGSSRPTSVISKLVLSVPFTV